MGSGYLATSIPTSFALDRPLHTTAVVLLLSGLAIVAYETRAAKSPRRFGQPAPTDRYVAIPLVDTNASPNGSANARNSTDETWSSEDPPARRDGFSQRALALLLAALLGVLVARIAVFHSVMKHIECSGPTFTVGAATTCCSRPKADFSRPSFRSF